MGKTAMVFVVIAMIAVFLQSALVEGRPDPREYSYPVNPLVVSPEEAKNEGNGAAPQRTKETERLLRERRKRRKEKH
ncbi:unnamed protein product [Cyprideis torosa]|uniref:Uncharacterized protein n=1 Tax=Cyprideis torosa TaxID=163714 RepID=A0A7R8WET7_9CRUS|nr:unnamed protein product [Cyprideis torosa]CAG0889889.1 unnamed protein product [Cyprideis torosa]